MIWKKLLEKWAKEWRDENLTDEQKRLIAQAKFDLWFGCREEGYPGWETATACISAALEDLPRQLYINEFCEDWSEREPEPEDCPECNATGQVECVSHPDYHWSDEGCPDCDGTGMWECPNCDEGKLEPSWEDWTLVERKQLVQAIVGKELAEYLK